jgi:alpha-ketoglutarate-dependent taurine dioxygenase
MNDISKRIAALSSDQQQLLELRLKQKGLSNQNITTSIAKKSLVLKPIFPKSNLPISLAQQRLWFLHQLEPNSTLYNNSNKLSIEGKLNLAAFKKSINEIIKRHKILQTIFPVVEDRPVQQIVSKVENPLAIIDLQNISETKTEIQRIEQIHFNLPFDLTEEPLLRITLLRLEAEKYELLVTMHHIIFDGWSAAIFIREMSELYEAFCNNKPSPLTKLPVQYTDFAVWQRQWLSGKVLETQQNYWQSKLGNNLPVLKLPTISSTKSLQNSVSYTKSFLIPISLSQAIHQLSRQEGVSLFMVLLSILKVLLQRYTNQNDIVVGTDIANRNRPEIELLIGFFVNILVLRTNLSGNPSFRELLKRVLQTTLEAYDNQDLPFDELVKILQPKRDLTQTTPLFQVLFVFQNTPISTFKLPELTIDLLEVENEKSRFDLALFMTETEQGFLGKWQYNIDLWQPETIEFMSLHFQTLLKSAMAHPDLQISDLEMIPAVEKQQKLSQKKERKTLRRDKFINARPKAMNLASEKLIELDYFKTGQNFPLIIRPIKDEIDAIEWAKNNREFIETNLLKHGAILFRGFSLDSIALFEQFARAICPHLFGEYGDLPREEVAGKVYGSTPYPPDKAILFHNESSHLHRFPLKIWFCCIQAAIEGGETPIVDCRKIYQLLAPELLEKFATKQLLYIRNYVESLDVSWQKFFRTDDRLVVEKYCRQAEIDCEWISDNILRTNKLSQAIAKHPKTGEMVFFNQLLLHHASCLDSEVRESLLSLFGEDKLPRNVYYGDGSPIEESIIAKIQSIYQQATICFPWQKGDVLMLDNMLTAHGRNPYVGSRKIVVAMGEMTDRKTTIAPNREEIYAV